MSDNGGLAASNFRTHWRLIVGVRAGLLLVVGLLSGIQLLPDDARRFAVTMGLLLAIAIVASLLPLRRPPHQLEPVVEAVAAAAVIALPFPITEGFLPYLMAPALAAGLLSGVATAITAAGLAGAVLFSARAVYSASELPEQYLSTAAQWVLLMLGLGLLAAWVRRIQAREDPDNESYVAAYRLLSQLRLVSRQLSGGLDPASLSQALLQSLRPALDFDRGAVFLRSPGGVLVPYAVEGADQLSWDADLSTDSALAEAWTVEHPLLMPTAFTPGESGHSAVLPLRIGVRTLGLVALERSNEPFLAAEVPEAARMADEAALRLETALLFAEVRQIATAEERRRLAREIHDGIAQELASLGYVLDDLAAQAGSDVALQDALLGLRQELTRVITELRLSIFDLRSDVQPSLGLGTALSDYVRQVGAGSKFTVHLVLDEAPARLPIDIEAELLRIAQEAVTNCRKHADAKNLWVTCRIDPPNALLRVEDDGVGLQPGRSDSYGLEIMRERAARIGAKFAVTQRPDGGTIVDLALGESASVAGDDRPAA